MQASFIWNCSCNIQNSNASFPNYVLGALIQPCRVELEKIASGSDIIEDGDDSSNESSEVHTEQLQYASTAELQQVFHPTTAKPIVNKKKISDKGQQKLEKQKWCCLCKKFMKQLRFGLHIKKCHENVTLLRCRSNCCANFFLTEADRQQHEEQVHSGEHNCIYCGHLFKTVRSTCNHMKVYHKEAIRCDFNRFKCSEFFHTTAEKDEHILKVHKTVRPRKEIKCINCGKLCPDKKAVRQHLKIVHRDISIILCKFLGCGAQFLNQSDSDKHFQQEHKEKDSLKIWQCRKCSFKTIDNILLQNHVKRFHTDATLQCPKCPRAFNIKYDLKNHLKFIHSKRYSCEHCGKLLYDKIVKRHLRIEICKICNLELPCHKLFTMHRINCSKTI